MDRLLSKSALGKAGVIAIELLRASKYSKRLKVFRKLGVPVKPHIATPNLVNLFPNDLNEVGSLDPSIVFPLKKIVKMIIIYLRKKIL